MSTRVTISKGRNGVEEIHRPGCADLKKRTRRAYSDREDWTIEIDTLADLYADYWDCIADEAVAGGQYATIEECYWAWRSEFQVMPCAGNIEEMPEPGTEQPCPFQPGDGRQCIGVLNHDGDHVLRGTVPAVANPTADRLAEQHNRTAYRVAELKAKIEWLEAKQRKQYAAAMAALHDGQQMRHDKESEYGAASLSVVY